MSLDTIFADFEETVVVPSIDYLQWVKGKGVSGIDELFKERRQAVTATRTKESWMDYLSIYVGHMTTEDFQEMANKYSLNPIFVQWVNEFHRGKGHEPIVIDILTKGFAEIIRLYFQRSDVKEALGHLGVKIGQIVGAECEFQNNTINSVSSAIYAKRPLVKKGHIMLGDNDEAREFGEYEHFVNLSTWKPSHYPPH